MLEPEVNQIFMEESRYKYSSFPNRGLISVHTCFTQPGVNSDVVKRQDSEEYSPDATAAEHPALWNQRSTINHQPGNSQPSTGQPSTINHQPSTEQRAYIN